MRFIGVVASGVLGLVVIGCAASGGHESPPDLKDDEAEWDEYASRYCGPTQPPGKAVCRFAVLDVGAPLIASPASIVGSYAALLGSHDIEFKNVGTAPVAITQAKLFLCHNLGWTLLTGCRRRSAGCRC